jgi:hypothetical protein
VIDEKMTERMVACGWIAAAIAGLITLGLSLNGGLGLTRLNLVDAALLLGLAYGIYRHSRTCALLVFFYHVGNRAFIYSHAQHVPAAIVAADLIFAALYVLGIVGTFAHHARRRAQPA